MNNLYRSSDEKVVGGVCAGLARKFNLNAAGIRWVVVLTSLFLTGVPVFVYVILWAVLKERPTRGITDI